MRVGSDIEAVCKKCGDVWHVVIALADRRIANVECKECGARHRYRGVKGETGAVRRKPAAQVDFLAHSQRQEEADRGGRRVTSAP